MKKTFLLLLITFSLMQSSFAQNSASEKEPAWKLGAQAYTFKNFTFAEALDKLNSVGVSYVEAYPGQKIAEDIEGTMHYNMDAATQKKVKDLLKSKEINLMAYGVVSGKNEEEWKKIFKFAKEMGIQIITSEPNPEHLDLVNQLAGQYNITLAIHNHPKPSRYWHPDTVLKSLEGRENLGATADVGHWVRSGLDPVENLKKLEGHIVSLHFKDLNEKSREAHDVPWGTGISNVQAMLKELRRQNFEGLFSIEYEHNWDNSLPEVEKSVNYFNKMRNKLY